MVVIPAGVPRKPGMTRDDLFNINAGIVKKLAEKIAVHCPQVCRPPAMHDSSWKQQLRSLFMLVPLPPS